MPLFVTNPRDKWVEIRPRKIQRRTFLLRGGVAGDDHELRESCLTSSLLSNAANHVSVV